MLSRTSRFLLVVSFYLFPLCAHLAAAQAEIAYLQGEVSVERRGIPIAGTIGMALELGDTVITGADGAVVISLTPQTTVKTRENTRVRIDEVGLDSSVELSSGGLFSRVIGHLTGSYEVTTPTTTAGVRGTEFFVAYGRTIDARPDLWLCVNSGTVTVSVTGTGKELLVPAGKGINILGGTELTAPRAYGWTKKLNWNMDAAVAPILDTTKLDGAYTDLLDQDYD